MALITWGSRVSVSGERLPWTRVTVGAASRLFLGRPGPLLVAAVDRVARLDAEANTPRPMICCYCPDWNPSDPANATASHGMCSTCEARLHAELDADPRSATA